MAATPFITVKPTVDMLEARLAVIGALRPFGDKLTAVQQLAVIAYMVGQLIALQDQTRFTPEDLMALVGENITAGNRDTITELLGPTAGEA